MFRLIESICLDNGTFHNLEHHQQRMDRSVRGVFGCTNQIDIKSHLHGLSFPKQSLFKCRVVYDSAVQRVEFIPYSPKPVSSLKVIQDNSISYPYKFEDRSVLEKLFNLRDGCDDIIIVRNGLVTDSSYSNLLFFDGANWLTPSQPLLHGTMRSRLLSEGKIKEMMIDVQHIQSMKCCRLINAMLGFDNMELSVSQIVF